MSEFRRIRGQEQERTRANAHDQSVSGISSDQRSHMAPTRTEQYHATMRSLSDPSLASSIGAPLYPTTSNITTRSPLNAAGHRLVGSAFQLHPSYSSPPASLLANTQWSSGTNATAETRRDQLLRSLLLDSHSSPVAAARAQVAPPSNLTLSQYLDSIRMRLAVADAEQNQAALQVNRALQASAAAATHPYGPSASAVRDQLDRLRMLGRQVPFDTLQNLAAREQQERQRQELLALYHQPSLFRPAAPAISSSMIHAPVMLPAPANDSTHTGSNPTVPGSLSLFELLHRQSSSSLAPPETTTNRRPQSAATAAATNDDEARITARRTTERPRDVSSKKRSSRSKGGNDKGGQKK